MLLVKGTHEGHAHDSHCHRLRLLDSSTYYYPHLDYQVHPPNTLNSKKYALNKVCVLKKQVSKYEIIVLSSRNISILSLILTGYGFVLPYNYMCSVHLLALLNCSMPDYIKQAFNNKNLVLPVQCMVLKSHVPGSDVVL